MKILNVTGLFGALLLAACSFNASTNPPQQPPPPPYYYAQNPNPYARPGVPPAPPQPNHPAPAWGAASEAVNVQRIAAIANANPKACGWLESSPNHWVKVDCHIYKPATRAI